MRSLETTKIVPLSLKSLKCTTFLVMVFTAVEVYSLDKLGSSTAVEIKCTNLSKLAK